MVGISIENNNKVTIAKSKVMALVAESKVMASTFVAGVIAWLKSTPKDDCEYVFYSGGGGDGSIIVMYCGKFYALCKIQSGGRHNGYCALKRTIDIIDGRQYYNISSQPCIVLTYKQFKTLDEHIMIKQYINFSERITISKSKVMASILVAKSKVMASILVMVSILVAKFKDMASTLVAKSKVEASTLVVKSKVKASTLVAKSTVDVSAFVAGVITWLKSTTKDDCEYVFYSGGGGDGSTIVMCCGKFYALYKDYQSGWEREEFYARERTIDTINGRQCYNLSSLPRIVLTQEQFKTLQGHIRKKQYICINFSKRITKKQKKQNRLNKLKKQEKHKKLVSKSKLC